MVLPTPFERLLQETSQLANRDPPAAYARLEELFGKTTTESDLLQLGAFAVHLGCAGLGRYDETAEFQRRLLRHPALNAASPTARSLWRGLAVVLLCKGDRTGADHAMAAGVGTDAERCRFAAMTAQTLAARGRQSEALPYLAEAAELMPKLPQGDETIAHGAAIGSNLARVAESQLIQARELLLAASRLGVAGWARHPEWRNRHRSIYHRGRALLLAGDPTRALQTVEELLALEEQFNAGPYERFHSAALACRAQAVRGAFKVADAALNACRDLAAQAPPEAGLAKALQELERAVQSLRPG